MLSASLQLAFCFGRGSQAIGGRWQNIFDVKAFFRDSLTAETQGLDLCCNSGINPLPSGRSPGSGSQI